MQRHASCVLLDGVGVLISGEAGTGKSSLCIELMSRGAKLVSDDRTNLTIENQQLIASSPLEICAMIEIYGLGVVKTEQIAVSAPIGFEVCLQSPPLERMPDTIDAKAYLGIAIPAIHQPARDTSVAAKTWLLAQVFQQTGRIDTVSVANAA